MIGDRCLHLPIHRKKAESIEDYLIFRFSLLQKILAIGGESGTGKTEIAEELQKILFETYKFRSLIIHIDDYYNTDYHNRDKVRKETGVVGKEEINWGKLNNIIKAYKKGDSKLYIQMIHTYLDKIIHMIVPTSTIDIIIIEGLYGCYFDGADVKIYLEGSINDTYSFRKKRGKENPDDPTRQWILEKERNSVVQSKRYADMIIPFNLQGGDKIMLKKVVRDIIQEGEKIKEEMT